MNERQQYLLKTITSQYIKTAAPVSSKMITECGDFDLSSATIRNEMAELENQGYIFHPHTSAGRVPTEKGYHFFVENFLDDVALSKRQQEVLNSAVRTMKQFEPELLKSLAKAMAEVADNAVFVAFSADDFFYTGLSNLFVQPEFAEHELVAHLSRVIDHLDQVLEQLFKKPDFEVEITIGAHNPFGRDCSSVLGMYRTHNQVGLLGILGPTRMDYQTNVNLIKYSRELVNQLR